MTALALALLLAAAPGDTAVAEPKVVVLAASDPAPFTGFLVPEQTFNRYLDQQLALKACEYRESTAPGVSSASPSLVPVLVAAFLGVAAGAGITALAFLTSDK